MIINKRFDKEENRLFIHVGQQGQTDHIGPILHFIRNNYNPEIKRDDESQVTFTIDGKKVLCMYDDLLPLGIYAADSSANEIVEQIAKNLEKLELVDGKLIPAEQ